MTRGRPVPVAPSLDRLFAVELYELPLLRCSLSVRRSSALARLRRTSFLLLMIFPGGGSSLRTFAKPMEIFFATGFNESFLLRKLRPPAALCHG